MAGVTLEIHHNIAMKHKFGDKLSVFDIDEKIANSIRQNQESFKIHPFASI